MFSEAGSAVIPPGKPLGGGVSKQSSSSTRSLFGLHFPDWAVVALAAPALLFPLWHPNVAVPVLVLTLILMCFAERPGTSCPRAPIAVSALLFMAVLGAAISPLPTESVQKLAGTVLGILVFRTMLRRLTRPDLVWNAAGLYVAVGLILLVVASLGTAWDAKHWLREGKYWILWRVSSEIPNVFSGWPSFPRRVNTNALAGTCLLFLPLALQIGRLAIVHPEYCGVLVGRVAKRARPSAILMVGVRAFFVLAALVLTGILILTESRTAWFSAAITVLVMLSIGAWDRRRFGFMSAIAAFLLMAITVSAVIAATHGAREVGLWERRDLWARAVYGIKRSPLVGVGLGAFRGLAQSYPSTSGAPVEADVVHAHNVFLQTALDVGLPGLLAYLVLFGDSLRKCLKLYRTRDDATAMLALGLLGNLLAVHLFGLADAIALGAKVGVFLWCSLALISCAFHVLPAPIVVTDRTH